MGKRGRRSSSLQGGVEPSKRGLGKKLKKGVLVATTPTPKERGEGEVHPSGVGVEPSKRGQERAWDCNFARKCLTNEHVDAKLLLMTLSKE